MKDTIPVSVPTLDYAIERWANHRRLRKRFEKKEQKDFEVVKTLLRMELAKAELEALALKELPSTND